MRAYSDLINHAFAYSALHHTDQLRKGTRVPYITHLANVAVILARYGCSDEVIAAAILHDVVEDCHAEGCSRESHARQIEEKFGREVLETVLSVTKPEPDGVKSGDALYLDQLALGSEAAHWVCAADKIHNARAMVSDLKRAPSADAFWGRFNKTRDQSVAFYRSVHDRLQQAGFDAPIMLELKDAADALAAAAEQG